MNWHKRSVWLPTAALAAALVVALGFLTFQASRDGAEAYAGTLELTQSLGKSMARRELELMRSRAGINNDYDRVASALVEIREQFGRLEAEAPPTLLASPSFAATMRQLRETGRAKNALVEQFKSSHSILRNSLAFLPTAAADSKAAAEASPGLPAPLRQQVVGEIDELLLSTLVFNQNPDERVVEIATALERLGRLAKPLTPQARERIDVLALHVAAVRREQGRANDLLAAIAAAPGAALLDRLAAIVAAEQQAAGLRVGRYRVMLSAFAALLIVLLVAAAVRVVRAHAMVTRANRALQEGNETLECRVLERTRELADADLIVQNSATILFRLGPAPHFAMTYVSSNIAKFGHDATALTEDRDWARRLIEPEDLPRVQATFLDLPAPGRPGGTIEYRVRTGDDSIRWVESRYQPMRDARGALLGVEGVVIDITAHKLAEAQLRDLAEREARHHQVLDAIAEPVLVKGPGSRIIWANRAFRDYIGMSNEALQGVLDAPQSEPDFTLAYVRDDALVFNSGKPLDIAEEPVTRHDGVVRTWHTVKSPLFDGEGRVVGTVGVSRDITEHKLAQVALRDSGAFLDQTGRIAGVGGWKVEVATMAVQWTDQTCRIHDLEPGHRPTVEEGVGYYPPEARPVFDQALQRSMATGERFDLELPLVTAKGRAIWVRAVGEPELVDGKPVRVIGAFQDITTRRALEDELRRNNEVLASVMENLPCGLSVFDRDLKLLASNQEYRRLLEYPDSLFDRPVVSLEDLLRFNAARGDYGDPGGDDIEAVIRRFLQQASNPPERYVLEPERQSRYPLEVRGARMPNGGFVLTHTDISARLAAEKERKRSERLLGDAIDAIDEGFILMDAEDRLVYCNKIYREAYGEFADMLRPGTTFEELLRITWTLSLYDDPDREGEDAWVEERLAAHRRGDRTLVQRLRDGRVVRIKDRRTEDGHTVGFRADITDLVSATDAAQAASLAKSQFLANMSHEIRTPMNAILGMLALLRRTELTARQDDYASKTEGAARSLLGLLNEILDFSKVEAGKMVLDAQPFDTEQLLRELAVIASATVGAKRVEVLFDVDPKLPRRLVGDAMRLQQVLINLMGNAVKFTPEGEVVLALRVVERDADAATVELSVRDTGIGIAPESHERIFSGFTQAEASTTRRFGGTGLGVAISQRLVALMGGELRLDSALGKGSDFHFRLSLPLADEAEEDAGPPPKPLRALVIDDNPTARNLIGRMGSSLGWTVDLADSGEKALEALHSYARAGIACDVVFVDWEMPGMDGWETSRRIRETIGTLPVVLMVSLHGHEMLAERSAAEQSLLDGYLVKPVTASALAQAVIAARSAEAGTPPLPAPPTVARLAGLRVLLVEDNANNRQVARELLEDEGAVVQAAHNGQQAVDALVATPSGFDVVLMDLQMPVMDGYAATGLIRQRLGLSTLPIVAMTANVLESDRAACLAAGMNDHIGKPFDTDRLIGTLRRQAGWAAVAEGARGGASTALALPVGEAAAAAGVDIEAALERLGGKQAIYRRMLATFVRDLGGLAARIERCADSADVAPLSQLLHTLKGLAATLGATSLATVAAEEEKRLDVGAPHGDMVESISRVGSAIATAGPGLDAVLQALLAAHGADGTITAPAPLDGPALRAALERLAGHLRQADMSATDAMDELLRRFRNHSLAARLAPLDDAIGALDFQRALVLCEALLATLELEPSSETP